MNFEKPPVPSPVVEHDSLSKEREKKARSKKLAYFIAGALGLGAVGVKVGQLSENTSDQSRPPVEVGYVSENALDLKEFGHKFTARLQIPSSNGKYVLHLAHMHGQAEDFGKDDPSYQQLKKQFLEVVANQQIDFGELVVFLQKQYGVNIVLEEGKTIDGRSQLGDISAAFTEVKKPDLLAMIYNQLPEYRAFILKPISSLKEYEVALMKLGNLQRAKDLYQSELQKLQDGGILDTKTWLIVKDETPSQADLQNMLAQVENVIQQYRQVLFQNRLDLKQQYAYHNGGIRFMQKIGELKSVEVAEAETTGGNLTAVTNRSASNKIREDVAIGLGMQQVVKNGAKFVPIRYGLGHDFSQRVTAYNKVQTNTDYQVGLIRIDHKVVESQMTEIGAIKFKASISSTK